MPLPQPKNVFFLVLPHVHALDLSGPVQAFYESNDFGADYRLRYVGPQERARSAQGLWFSDLEPLPPVEAGDLVVVPGIDSRHLRSLDAESAAWLRRAHAAGALLCSICSGAFLLAQAGLLAGRQCTTHWKVVERLQHDYPAARVVDNRLFVRDGRILTSAGVASGIDLALALIEEDHGPLVTARTAREMVVYMRRDGSQPQDSIYLDYRTHLHPGIHRVQDWLVAHPDEQHTIEDLAKVARMSSRNLTRVFRQATGITLKDFSTRLKLEVAGNLLHNPDLTVEGVASRCGFKDSRQLRRLWKQNFGESPTDWKAREARRMIG